MGKLEWSIAGGRAGLFAESLLLWGGMQFPFADVAGIRPVTEQPGDEHFVIKPWIGGTLTYASATYESPYGQIESSWEKTDEGVDYRIVVPVNTTATVMLEGSEEDTKRLLADFESVYYKDGRVILEVGSDSYHIKVQQ
nr:alpha-L-rhamnosidase C-terminal domain-containing protein [Paenibacillus sp. FSL P4-0081]